ncbi:MAG: hypothetical protein JW760_03460, partial [Spirochaetales bacterium]|nr:hypothetical protein [Spirochaetales bacterium]
MRSAQKVAFSLLISVAVFAAFTFLAYSGLFSYLESNFYYPRVRQAKELELEAAAKAVDEYITINSERFQSAAQEDFLIMNYLPNQSQENIYKTTTFFELLQKENPGFLFFRLTDTDGNIHFSTLQEDEVERQRYKVVYKSLDEVDAGLSGEDLILTSGDEADFILDPINQHMVFRYPIYDGAADIFKGTGLFYVSGKDLLLYLLKANVLDIGQQYGIVKGGYIINLNPEGYPEILESLAKAWSEDFDSRQIVPLLQDSEGSTLYLMSLKTEKAGVIGLILREDEFTLSGHLKILLLLSFGLTFFLIVFLVLSFKQDSLLVLSNRIKRFEADFLKQYVEKKEALDWESWKRELQNREEEVKTQIKKGIGRVKKDNKEKVDTLIEKSWQDLLSLIGTKVEHTEKKRLEVENLEEIIQTAIEKATMGLSTAPPIVQRKAVSPLPVKKLEEPEEAE